MLTNVKELIVVLVIATAIFRLGRSIVLRFCSGTDFSRRCTAWYLLTAAAFLVPSFWLFIGIAAPVILWLGRRDENPAASYLMLLYVVPPISSRIPMVGISYLVDLDFPLLLSLLLLTPAAARFTRTSRGKRNAGWGPIDLILLIYFGLTSVLFVRPEIAPGVVMTWTTEDCVRRAVVFMFGLVVPYFVISRSTRSWEALREAMACFCVACAVFAAIGLFEATRHWLLYKELMDRWRGLNNVTLYLGRNDSLRAMASTGHPLTLGLLLTIAFGFWLSLQHYLVSAVRRLGVMVLLWVGLMAAYSRGPWIGAVIIYFIYAMLQPKPISKLLKATAVAVLVASVVAISPLGSRVVDVLPFLGGTVATGDVIYRHLLFERAWQIIQHSPLFGDPYALLKMQDLRQGEGIIDLINGYIVILLNNGFVGLGLYLTFIFLGVGQAWAASRRLTRTDPRLARVGASLIACIVGLLVMIEGLGSSDLLFCILVGFTVAYAQLERRMQWQRREDPRVGLDGPIVEEVAGVRPTKIGVRRYRRF